MLRIIEEVRKMSKTRKCDICGRTEEQMLPYNGKMTTFLSKGWIYKEEFDICSLCLKEIKRKTDKEYLKK